MPPIEKSLIVVIIAEIVVPLSVAVLRPGFDKKNSLGLDFDFVVQMGWCFSVFWLVGFSLAAIYRKEKKRYLFTQLGMLPLFLSLLYGGYSLYLK